jgi:S1-C subfamily serine protease
VITRVGEHAIADADDLSRAISSYKPGEHARLELHRDGATKAIDVRLGERPLHARAG